MLTKEDGFELPFHWNFPDANKYAFAFIALFVFLVVIYSNSFQGALIFDDPPNITENSNIQLQSLDWQSIKKTFHQPGTEKLARSFAYFSFAMNFYFHGFDLLGYHLTNLVIHYLAAVFLFLFIYNTLKLPSLRERYGPSSYSIALLAVVLWATSPLQVTAVTYIVQRMASMAGLFYIMAMYFYLKGRMSEKSRNRLIFWGMCLLSAVLSVGSKENAVLLPLSIWLFDLLLIQGASRAKIIRNLKIFIPVVLVVGAVGLWYVNIDSIISGAAYEHRPFTLMERLLTQPRIVIFYISLLLYPLGSRLTLIHDIEWSSSLVSPWSTMPAFALTLGLILLAFYLARRSPLISFAILFYFLNHAVESTFLPLELIFEHRNYIPSMFFFAPVAVAMIHLLDYFAYKPFIQLTYFAVFSFILFAQGHVVYERNILFSDPLRLWTDNVLKAPNLSRPYTNLGNAYAKKGLRDNANELFLISEGLNRQTNLTNRGTNFYNLGMYALNFQNDYDAALSYFESALKHYPNFVPSYNGIANALIGKGELVSAEKRIREALSRWPQNSSLHYSYALILLKSGKYDDAVKEAKIALSLNPNQFISFSVLGEAYRSKGNLYIATAYWEMSLARYPDILEPKLALIELYWRQKRQNDLSRMVRSVILFKGSTTWPDLINQFNRNVHKMAYKPSKPLLFNIVKEEMLEELTGSH